MLVYTVKNGDTLWQVAKEHQISLDALLAANPQISDPNYILPGVMLNIPRLFRMPMRGGAEMGLGSELELELQREMGMQREIGLERELELEREMRLETDIRMEREMEPETELRMATEPMIETIPEPSSDPYCAMAGARPCILVTKGGETLHSISEEWGIPLAQLHYHNYQYAKNTPLPDGERVIIPLVPDYRIDMSQYNQQNSQQYSQQYAPRGRRRR